MRGLIILKTIHHKTILHLFTFQTPIFHKVMKYKNIIFIFIFKKNELKIIKV